MFFAVYLEIWRATDELGKLSNVESQLMEEGYMKVVE
jgi:hypothetical protein